VLHSCSATVKRHNDVTTSPICGPCHCKLDYDPQTCQSFDDYESAMTAARKLRSAAAGRGVVLHVKNIWLGRGFCCHLVIVA
jgi:hypothetical protein